MKAIFGVLSLLIVLAIAGSLVVKQLRAFDVPAAGTAPAPAGGTPAEQSRQLQRKVADDVNRLMQQAPSRQQGAEQ